MLNNKEKELLLKLLIEKASEATKPSLELVKEPKKVAKKKAKKVFPFGTNVWSAEELMVVRDLIDLGKSDREISDELGNRTEKSIYMIRYRMKAAQSVARSL